LPCDCIGCQRLLGTRIGRNCWIRRIEVQGRNPWDIVIGDGGVLEDHVALLIKRFKYLAAFPFFGGSDKILQSSKAAGVDQ